MKVVTLRDPSSSVAAQFVPDAGMIGTSLTDSGVELLGQRRGLPQVRGGEARYVTRIDPASNTIVIGREDELAASTLTASELNLIRPERFAAGPVRVEAMTRYRARPAAALAEAGADGRLTLQFDAPERAVTPGQLVALFEPGGDEVLGAATIESAA